MAYNRITPQLQHRLDAAVAAHERGDIHTALASYRAILDLVPEQPVALNLLGTGLLQLGDPAQALAYLQRAARLQRDNAGLLSNLGHAYLAMGRYPDAAEAFRKASRVAPKEPQFQVGVATALALQGRLADAETLLRRQVARFPATASVWLALGNVLRDLHSYEPAVEAYRKACELDPRNAEAHNSLGRVLHAAGHFGEAEVQYRRSMELEPGHMAARFNLASVIIDVGRFAEAESICRDIVAREPQNAEAYAFLAAALGHQGRLIEAAVCHEAAASRAPRDPKYLGTYGAALFEIGRAPEARRVLVQAVAASRGDEASEHLFGNALLAHGALQDGWRGYAGRPAAARFRTKYPAITRSSTLPLDDVRGRHVCLLREQGLGDEIFFLRYARVLNARGARVSYRAGNKIAGLVSRVSEIAQAIEETAPLPEADVYMLIGDLPHALGAAPCTALAPAPVVPRRAIQDFAERILVYSPPVPASISIEPLPENLERMRERLTAAGPPPYIGVTWRAGTPPDQQESVSWMLYKHIALPDLAAALKTTRGTVVALQRSPFPGETDGLAQLLGRTVHDFTAWNEDLESMLAVLALLDEYVGVSNTNMHLRAAVGRRARVLVPAPAEWRWRQSGRRSPWFPEFRLYRQSLQGRWDDALRELAADLAELRAAE